MTNTTLYTVETYISDCTAEAVKTGCTVYCDNSESKRIGVFDTLAEALENVKEPTCQKIGNIYRITENVVLEWDCDIDEDDDNYTYFNDINGEHFKYEISRNSENEFVIK